MHAAKIVVRDIERDGRRMVFESLAECISQPREASASHAERKIAAFRIAGRNLHRDAAYNVALYGDYLSRRIAPRSLVYVEVDYAVGFAHDTVRNALTEGVPNRR